MGNLEAVWRISARVPSWTLSQDWHTVHKLASACSANEAISRQSVRGFKLLTQQKLCDYGKVNTLIGECGAVPPVPNFTEKR